MWDIYVDENRNNSLHDVSERAFLLKLNAVTGSFIYSGPSRLWGLACSSCASWPSRTAGTSVLPRGWSRWPSAWSSWPSVSPWVSTVATLWTRPGTWGLDSSPPWPAGAWRSSGTPPALHCQCTVHKGETIQSHIRMYKSTAWYTTSVWSNITFYSSCKSYKKTTTRLCLVVIISNGSSLLV